MHFPCQTDKVLIASFIIRAHHKEKLLQCVHLPQKPLLNVVNCRQCMLPLGLCVSVDECWREESRAVNIVSNELPIAAQHVTGGQHLLSPADGLLHYEKTFHTNCICLGAERNQEQDQLVKCSHGPKLHGSRL